jgi:hypothetical protein
MSFYTQFFIRPYKHPVVQPLAGSFLMDDQGGIRSSTLPNSFPQDRLQSIASNIFKTFQTVRKALMECNELRVDYPALSLQAKRGPRGTMVYITSAMPPQSEVFVGPCPGLES